MRHSYFLSRRQQCVTPIDSLYSTSTSSSSCRVQLCAVHFCLGGRSWACSSLLEYRLPVLKGGFSGLHETTRENFLLLAFTVLVFLCQASQTRSANRLAGTQRTSQRQARSNVVVSLAATWHPSLSIQIIYEHGVHTKKLIWCSLSQIHNLCRIGMMCAAPRPSISLPSVAPAVAPTPNTLYGDVHTFTLSPLPRVCPLSRGHLP